MEREEIISEGQKVIDIRSLLLLFLILTSLLAVHAPLEWDEGSFLMNAQYFSGDGKDFEESRPAALSFLISLIWSVTGESRTAGRVLVAFFGMLCIYGFYRLAEMEFDEPLLVTAVFSFAPLLLYWSSHVYSDVPGLAFVLLALYSYRNERHILTGISLSAAITFRYVFGIFAVGLGLAYIVENRRQIYRYAAGGLTGALPFLGHSHLNYGSPWSKMLLYLRKVLEWSESGLFAATLPNFLKGIYMLSALVPASLKGWRNTPVAEKSMLLSYTFFVLFISGNAFQRYWLPALPFLLLIAYRGLDRKMFAVAASIMLMVSAHGVGTNYLTQAECTAPLEESLEYVSGYESLVISDSWATAGYLLDNPVQSPWTDLESLRKGEGAEYAVMRGDYPFEVMESFSSRCVTYHVYDLHEPIEG